MTLDPRRSRLDRAPYADVTEPRPSESSDLLAALRAAIEAQPEALEAVVDPPLHHLAGAVTVTVRLDRELLLRFMRRWY